MNSDTLKELLQYKARLHAALVSADICVFEIDLIRRELIFLENAQAIFGLPDEDILLQLSACAGLPPEEYAKALSRKLVHPDDREILIRAYESIPLGKHTSYQLRMRTAEGLFIWCRLDITPLFEADRPVRMIGVISDISGIKDEAEELQQAVGIEAFTGLYTRARSEELIEKAFSKDPIGCHALILFDLDDFKRINDSHGHMAGDAVLKNVAEQLKKAFRRSDIIGRFGGDEFLILLKDIPDRSILISKLELLSSQHDETFGVTKSIGVSIFPKDGLTFAQLLKKADTALYRAKETKDAWVIYSEDM